MLKNNKGGVYAVIVGLSMIAIGMIGFIILNSVFLGTTGNNTTGLFGIAENNLNISPTDPTYQTINSTWRYVPLGLIFAGLIYMVVASQWREPQEYGPYYRR
jgi:hypothetical protein